MTRTTEKPQLLDRHMSAFGGHPLQLHVAAYKAAATGNGADPVNALADLGVTDAEQLVALNAIPDVGSKVAAAIGLEKQDFESLVEEAQRALPPPVAAEMTTPLPPMFGLGAMEPPEREAAYTETAVPEEISSAPVSAAANLIANMPAIRNQGARGTCVSFALTAMQDYYRRLHGIANPNFSEQHLYHETKLIDGAPADCGTWQKYGARVLATRGQCRELVWAYNPNLPCNNNGVMPPAARPNALNYRLNLSALPPTNAALIRSALSSRRPVGISIPVFNSWYLSAATRRSGQITMPFPGEARVGGHAVCLVGFQDSPSVPGGGYFILRNSWGTTWGSLNPYGAGYGVIPYAYITSLNWEAFTPTSIAVPDDQREEQEPRETTKPRTITLKIKGDVNIVLES